MLPYGTGVQIEEGSYKGQTGFIADYVRNNVNSPFDYLISITLGPNKNERVKVPSKFVRELGT